MSFNMELVSAVVSTYNRPVDVVLRAVKSIQQQTYDNIEIIVVNDYPNDTLLAQELGRKLHETDCKIKYIVHEVNKGACAARNTGLAAATGKYIAFLDDDDEWMNEKIQKQVQRMDENVGLVYCDSVRVNKKEQTIYKQRKPGKNPLNKILSFNYIGATSFPLLNTEYLRAIGGFDEKISSCQDYDVWIRMVEHYDVAYIAEPLGKYYLSDDSTFKSSNKKYIQGDEYLLDKYKTLYKKYPLAYMYHISNMAFNGKYFLRDEELFNHYYDKIKKCRFARVYWLCMPVIKAINKIVSR